MQQIRKKKSWRLLRRRASWTWARRSRISIRIGAVSSASILATGKCHRRIQRTVAFNKKTPSLSRVPGHRATTRTDIKLVGRRRRTLHSLQGWSRRHLFLSRRKNRLRQPSKECSPFSEPLRPKSRRALALDLESVVAVSVASNWCSASQTTTVHR